MPETTQKPIKGIILKISGVLKQFVTQTLHKIRSRIRFEISRVYRKESPGTLILRALHAL